MPIATTLAADAETVRVARSVHTWPPSVRQFEDKARRTTALAFWADFQRSRAHVDWTASDLILLAEVVRLSVTIAEAHETIEREGFLAETATGRAIQHPAVGALSSLQSARSSLLHKLRLATGDADSRTSQVMAKREAAAAKALGDGSDIFGEVRE